jgi:hypothetical protein
VAATADAAVREVSDAADDVYNDVLRPGWELEVRLARDEATAVTDAAEYGIHAAGTMISDAAQAGSRVYHEVTRVAEAIGHEAVHLVKTAYHDAAKAATATVAFVKRHAALIVSLEVGAAVFAGCEAVTLGIGSIGCAALAGAASSMASYAVTAAQTGHFSVGGLLMAGATGALIGAATAGLLQGVGAIAGGLLGSGAEAGASTMVQDAASTAAGDSASSATAAAGDSAAEDTGAKSAAEDAGSDVKPGCGESFTASTKVLLASGAAIPISQLQDGEKVLATNVKTGKTQAETVAAVTGGTSPSSGPATPHTAHSAPYFGCP